MKKFRVYNGLLFVEFVGLLFLGLFTLFALTDPATFTLGIFSVGGLLFLLFFLAKHISYSLEIKGWEIVERLWFKETRRVGISSITAVTRTYYFLPPFSWVGGKEDKEGEKSSLLVLLLAITKLPAHYVPMMEFVRNEEQAERLPMFPISPKIVSSLLENNRRIHIDHHLADILPSNIRNELGIRLTAVDTIGITLWKTFSSILALLLFALAFLVLFGLLGNAGFSI